MRIKTEKVDAFFSMIFALYLGVSTIFWLPYLGVLEKYKITLFFLLCFYITVPKQGINIKINLDQILLFLFLLLLIFFISSQLINHQYAFSNGTSWYFVINAVQIILFVSVVLKLNSVGWFEKAVYRSVIIFCIFASASLVLMIFYPNYINPLNDKLTLQQSGFGGSRTSWSPSLAFFLPWVFIPFVMKNFFWVKLSSFAMIVIFIANQVIVQGRAGLLADMVFMLVFVFMFTNRIKLKIFSVMIFTLLVSLGYYFREYIRLGGDVEDLSNGRFERNIEAISYIQDNPLWGHGYGFFKDIEGVTVHNVFLKHAVDSGLFVALTMAAIVSYVFLKVNRTHLDQHGQAAYLTLISGLTCAMIEPSLIFGSFNASALWWACYAYLLSTSSVDKENL